MPLGMPGNAWFDFLDPSTMDILAPSTRSDIRIKSLAETRVALSGLLHALLGRCGWSRRQLFFFGFSQGAQVVTDLVLHFDATHAATECKGTTQGKSEGCRAGGRFGGVVCVSSSLLPEAMLAHWADDNTSAKAPTSSAAQAHPAYRAAYPGAPAIKPTPLLVTHGTLDKEQMPIAEAQKCFHSLSLLWGRASPSLFALPAPTRREVAATLAGATRAETAKVQWQAYRKGHTMCSTQEEGTARAAVCSIELYGNACCGGGACGVS